MGGFRLGIVYIANENLHLGNAVARATESRKASLINLPTDRRSAVYLSARRETSIICFKYVYLTSVKRTPWNTTYRTFKRHRLAQPNRCIDFRLSYAARSDNVPTLRFYRLLIFGHKMTIALNIRCFRSGNTRPIS